MRKLVPALLGALTMLLAATACATGKDAVVAGAGEFQFVAPGGQTEIAYPKPQRQVLPEISGDDLINPGQQVDLSSYPNTVVVLNIWGSWCGPCRAEAPELQQIYQQTKASGVQVIGIDVRDQRDAAVDFYRNQSLTYPSIFDPPARSLLPLQGYPRTTVPSTLLLDRQHRVAWVSLSAVNSQQLLGKINELLAEKP